MKKAAIAIASIFTTLAPAAFAQDYQYRDQNRDYRGDRRDFARVIDSRPVQESVAAGQECFTPRAGVYEEVRGENKTRIGKGAAIGAIAGGVLGHQVDTGTGTAAGAILGGLLGHHLERRNDGNEQNDLDFSRCRAIGGTYGAAGREGYEVRYEYNGQEYVTFMDRDPGRRLRVGEDISHDGTPLVSSQSGYSWR